MARTIRATVTGTVDWKIGECYDPATGQYVDVSEMPNDVLVRKLNDGTLQPSAPINLFADVDSSNVAMTNFRWFTDE